MNPQSVDPKKLKFLEFNPDSRTTDRALSELYDSMKKDGFWEHNPIKINKESIIIDGHRRTSCAINLGIPRIPAFVIDINAAAGWAKATLGVRPIKSTDLYRSLLQGLPIEYIPDTNVGRAARRVIERYGLETLFFCAESGVSSSVFSQATKLAVYLGHEGDRDYEKELIRWLVGHRYIRDIRTLMDIRVSPEKIKAAVESNLALSL